MVNKTLGVHMPESIKIAVKPYKPMPIDDLYSLQKDLKSLSDESYAKLKNEIITTGFAFVVHLWRDKNGKHWLVDGHQRWDALNRMRQEGFKVPKVPTALVDAKNMNEARARVFQGISQYGKITEKGFQRFTEDGKFDVQSLDLRFDLPDFSIPNFVESHFRSDPQKEEIEDQVPDTIKVVKVRKGELYILGEHRLLCGDGTDGHDLQRLIGEEDIDMVFTDPPYGMKAVSSSGVLKKKYGNDILNDDSPDTAKNAFKAMQAIGIKKQIWWGANYYSSALPDAACWLVWDKNNGGSDQTDCELAWTNLPGVVRQFTQASEKQNRVHPTQKPVSLIEWALEKYEAKTVLDIFGGSGSTLIACQKTKRKSFIMEMDPHYCHVILDRWAQYSEQDPIREDGVLWSKVKTQRNINFKPKISK